MEKNDFQNNDLEMIDIDKKDPDMQVEQESIEIDDGSVLLSDYQDLPPLESDEIDQETLEEESESSIHIEYSFNGDDVAEGLASVQNTLMIKKKIVYTVCLFILFSVYMLDYSNIQSMILGCLSLLVIGVVWVVPLIHIKRFSAQADEKPINLNMNVYESFIKVYTNGNESNVVTLTFKKQIDNIIETQNLFVICAGKTRVFIIPKRCINENIHEFIREIFKIAMEDKFYSKN